MDMKNYNHDREKEGTGTPTATVKPVPCVPRFKKNDNKTAGSVYLCARINFEAVIEMFVRATDVRQDGGPLPER